MELVRECICFNITTISRDLRERNRGKITTQNLYHRDLIQTPFGTTQFLLTPYNTELFPWGLTNCVLPSRKRFSCVPRFLFHVYHTQTRPKV
jgi:hypothetical protein